VNDREMVAFLRRMASQAAPIPLILYNPPHAKRRLAPPDFETILAQVPQVIGIKVADGDEGWYASMRTIMDRCSVFVPGHHLATGVARGARGSYSNVACLNPAAAQRWYRQMIDDPRSAADLEGRMNAFFGERIAPFITEKGYSNGAADKLLAAVGGWGPIGTRLRWPYESIPEAVVPAIRARGRELVPEFFA
jgi:dihydrodipicolinate synthase/N-acetylneuraminate lyase